MPHFFFHVQDGTDDPDMQGAELPDLAAARREALRFAGALLMEASEAFWRSAEWRMRVVDAAGLTQFELMVLVREGG